jgi:hypothetical protein
MAVRRLIFSPAVSSKSALIVLYKPSVVWLALSADPRLV